MVASIFLDFWLPNATTWFYFSLLLAVALFFKFSRFLSVRNWDVLTIFLLMPGMLLIEDAQPTPTQKRLATAAVIGAMAGNALGAPATGLAGVGGAARSAEVVAKPSLKLGYVWLLIASGYLL